MVILAGYADRMDKFFRSNPGFRSRIAHHIDFPDYTDDELVAIADLMLARQIQAERERAQRSPNTFRSRRAQPLSPMRVRSAMRSTGCACGRPIGCSPSAIGN